MVDQFPTSAAGASTKNAGPDGQRPWYTSWWAIASAAVVALVVVVGVVVGTTAGAPSSAPTAGGFDNATGTEDVRPEDSGESSPSAEPTPEPSPTPEPEPAPEPPPEPAPAPVEEYSGAGAQVVTLDARDARIVTFTHAGASNFAVWAVDDRGQDVELLVNEIGSYSGTHPLNFIDGEGAAALKIEADGQWTVTSAPVSSAPSWDGAAPYAATGSAVVLVAGAAEGLTPVTFTHQGESNFAVWAYGDYQDLLVNEIGAYSGETLLPAGTVVIAVQADGPWSLATS